ncbi:MAG: LytTR family DNA-binding domain-containing protein [Bacteroidales bacterium]|jgi:two-component system LytT family response regulator|nr:LytTR family DNA-binding domain-containing protein [Bacteroidales bacterium]
MIRAVIIDDEPKAIEALRFILEFNFPDIDIVATAQSVDSGYNAIIDNEPDLLFLDIDIHGGTGFNILSKFKKTNFRVIFITAHNDYAIKAIKFNAFDYILKPINEFELIKGVESVIADIKNSEHKPDYSHITDDTKEIKRITLKTSDSIYFIDLNDIIRCESDNSYTTFHTKDGEKILVSKAIKYYEDLLTDLGFVRVHQSHIVNISNVLKYSKRDGGYISMIDGSTVPVSQRKRMFLLDIFKERELF